MKITEFKTKLKNLTERNVEIQIQKQELYDVRNHVTKNDNERA